MVRIFLRLNAPELLRQLLQVNPNPGVNVADKFGWSPLHILAQNRTGQANKCEMIDVLLQRRADVNVRGRRGATPLLKAAGSGAVDQVRLLLSRGADPNLALEEGTTPYDAAWHNRETRDIVYRGGGRAGAGTTGKGRQIGGRKVHLISRERF